MNWWTCWLFLSFAIALEVSGTTCMKLAEGFTRPLPGVLVFVFYGLSLASLTVALKAIDVSIAYAVWAGAGTALIAAIGWRWFGESMTWAKGACLAMIVAGVVGLNLLSRPG